ncbi:MAG: Translation factor SUA5 [Candidatus Uhrbacteria bacterium GW2011_GWE2_45_35]|uniref:L-threonylcarbamoyladenylate synthase n=2 Tax=Candidatus Uhriibacteriota TaxID=1752732 RepID=A0A0G1LS41_9BACT|nr:MAG: Translation factor SUA5 [Candidatus Uhrbacteria bacterium GW2011_GWF2_44_350]KKU08447.1 MAG: Translation factor SUA5 [Candidatus Uhrbacteria bacterium GW2011_GWE2_45_35]HBR80788.1 threonylcarbamoyl-AMP synthase [Candidatus Uhrbacteria bacterium]HCU31645.1 threonylcarbamoyl-AMP synthase [Candidatus Uhrbacteria bacterium]
MKKINEEIKKAVEILKAGGVVVFPTETAYGLAADATNEKAVRRVFAIKGREGEKTFPMIAASSKMVEKYAILSPNIKKIVKKYWPGPLTVVAPVRIVIVGANGHSSIRSGTIRNGTVAIRVSSNPIAEELSRRLGRPIVSTSANLSGGPACYSVRAVKNQLGDKPDFYFDVGRLPKRKPSTIITEKNGEVIILRVGSIKL